MTDPDQEPMSADCPLVAISSIYVTSGSDPKAET